MNIFWLDSNLSKAAEYHVASHITKMPLESAQLINTVYWVATVFGHVPEKLSKEQQKHLLEEYKRKNRKLFPYWYSYINHPCNIWARSSEQNFEELLEYHFCLSDEFEYRRGGKRHASSVIVSDLVENVDPRSLNLPKTTEFEEKPQCMPDEYKCDDVIEAYRKYYSIGKAHLHDWEQREAPEWL